MADNYLQLLDNSTRLAVGFMQQVDETLTKGFRDQEQVRQFEKQIQVRASEFQAEMAYKDAALEEQKRMNEAQTARWKFNDELAAKELEHRFALMPLELETRKVQLEAAKIGKQRQIEEDRNRNFNTITSPFDTQAAATLAGNRDAGFGNDYLTLKSKYQAQVAAGQPFNEQAFRSEFDALQANYNGVVPNKEYDPEVAVLMERMGASSEAARMRAENPTFAGNLEGLKAGALLAGPQATNEMLAKYGFAFTKEEATNFAAGSEAYFGYGEEIKRLQNQERNLTFQWRDAKSPQDKQKISDQITDVRNQQLEASKKQRSVYQNTIGVKISSDLQQQNVEEEEVKRIQAEIAKSRQEIPTTSSTTPQPVSTFESDYELKNKQSNINAYSINFPEALPNMGDFRGWSGHRPRSSQNYVTNLRNDIIKNISSIPTDKADAKEGQKTLEELIDTPVFGDIFNKLKERSVEVPYLGSGEGLTTSIGNRNFASFLGTGGFDITGFTEIENHAELKKLIQNFRGTPEQKRRFIEKLYASVVAAGAVDQMDL